MNTIHMNKEDIINRYNNGEKCYNISQHYNVNSGLIYYYLKSWNILKNKIKTYNSIEDNKDKIISLFKEDRSCYYISSKLNIPKANIIRFLKKQGFDTSKKKKTRRIPIKIYNEDIINLYLSGLSTNRISKLYLCGQSSILKLLKENNIKSRTISKYSVNESFFEKIDSEFKSYILGWMYSDGNVTSDKFRIQIQEEDAYILEWIAKQLEYNGPLYSIKPPLKYPWRKHQKCLCISRKKMVQDLIKLGCVYNKSLILNFPNESQIPKYLLSHFMRGYMDGDGSIRKRKSGSLNCSFVCSFNFLNGFSILAKENNWTYNVYDKNKSKQVMFTDNNNAVKFLSYIYKNNNVCLHRKSIKLV